jgi:hypothetical protein
LVALSESTPMTRNLNQFSEFQLGFIQSIADAIGGDVVWEEKHVTCTVRNQRQIVILLWQHGREPDLWNGKDFVPLSSRNMTLPEYLYALTNPGDELRRVADALNALLDSGAIENMGDAADAAAKFFDSLGDATVDDEDDEEDA